MSNREKLSVKPDNYHVTINGNIRGHVLRENVISIGPYCSHSEDLYWLSPPKIQARLKIIN